MKKKLVGYVINNFEEAKSIKYLPFNRDYGVRNDLMNSMNKYGFVGAILLIKTNLIDKTKENVYIVDGQHRLATALHLGIPINALMVEHKFKSLQEIVEFVASLNTAQKPWSIDDYVSVYNYLNFPNYARLLEIKKGNNYTCATLATLLSGLCNSKSNVSSRIKSGKFEISEEDETLTTLRFSGKLSKYSRLNSRMLVALHYVMKSPRFNPKVFESKYKSNFEALRELKLDDYTDIFNSWVR